MSHLVTGFVLISTILLAMAVGVGSGYFIISAILNGFARKPQETKAAPALAPQGVTGD